MSSLVSPEIYGNLAYLEFGTEISHCLMSCWFISSLLTPSGGDLRGGDPANEIPRVAAVWLLPGAGVGLQASDGGHAGGEAFCHCGGCGPCDWYMCQQHCTLPTTVQQDGGVSDAAAQQHWVIPHNSQEKHIHTQLKGSVHLYCVRYGRVHDVTHFEVYWEAPWQSLTPPNSHVIQKRAKRWCWWGWGRAGWYDGIYCATVEKCPLVEIWQYCL